MHLGGRESDELGRDPPIPSDGIQICRTGYSANYLMFGREVATKRPIWRGTFPDQWIWELKENVEDAYRFVRQHTAQAVLQQKYLHDQKLFWLLFKPGDEVYCIFPGTKLDNLQRSHIFEEVHLLLKQNCDI